MIEHVQAFNRDDARDLLKRAWGKNTPTFGEHLHPAWIGVEPAVSPLRHFILPKYMIIRIPDVTEPEDKDGVGTSFQDEFLKDDVIRIADFVQTLVNDSLPWALLVHCTAGISRSAAIATWVQEKYKVLPEDRFSSLHARTRPNKTLLRYLRNVGVFR